ncbi:MAG: RibD family protein [Pseudanabaenaceae cyanobacterium]|jgi:2,5-diamino-6-(ribosylamino)-4(3H)-pyrimidinone 5'-phosphate reductase
MLEKLEKLYATAPGEPSDDSPLGIYSFQELNLPDAGVSTVAGLRPYVIINMIASADGRATTTQGTMTGLSSPEDRRVMRYLRCQVDGVMVGAATLRADPVAPILPPDLVVERLKYFDHALPHAAQPWGIVVTQSGVLPLNHRFWERFAGCDLAGCENQRLIIAPNATKVNPELLNYAKVCAVPELSMDLGTGLAVALPALYQRWGIRRLLVEGGATVNYAMIAQGLVDELFLTVAPCLVGGIANSNILAGAGFGLGDTAHLPKLKLLSVYHRDSYLFLRYRVVAN